MSERKIPSCSKCKKRMNLNHIVENEHEENLPSCKATCPYKVSDQYQIYSNNKKKETLPVSLNKWM